MHNVIVQEFKNYMRCLKYLVYHHHMMTNPWLAVSLVFTNLVVLVIYEFINMQILLSRTTVFAIIGSYIVAGLLININTFSF
jgi:hypothetical protein